MDQHLPPEFAEVLSALPMLTEVFLPLSAPGIAKFLQPQRLAKLELSPVYPYDENAAADALQFFASNSFPKLTRLSLAGINTADILRVLNEQAPLAAGKFPVLESISIFCFTNDAYRAGYTGCHNGSLRLQAQKVEVVLPELIQCLSAMCKLSSAVKTLSQVDLRVDYFQSVAQVLAYDCDFVVSRLPKLLGLPVRCLTLSGRSMWDALLFDHFEATKHDDLFAACFSTPLERLDALLRALERGTGEIRFWCRQHFQEELRQFLEGTNHDAIVGLRLVTLLALLEQPAPSTLYPWGLGVAFESLKPEDLILVIDSITATGISLPIILSLGSEIARSVIETRLLALLPFDWLCRQGLVDYYFTVSPQALMTLPNNMWRLLSSKEPLRNYFWRFDPQFLRFAFIQEAGCVEREDVILNMLEEVVKETRVLVKAPSANWHRLMTEDGRAIKSGRIFCDCYDALLLGNANLVLELHATGVPIARYQKLAQSCLETWYGRQWEAKDEIRLQNLVFSTLFGGRGRYRAPTDAWALEYFGPLPKRLQMYRDMCAGPPRCLPVASQTPVQLPGWLLKFAVDLLPIHIVQRCADLFELTLLTLLSDASPPPR